jgi:multidrug efflux pump subunit AcrA (membrane-fusion protein)
LFASILLNSAGCDWQESPVDQTAKKPRPVEVQTFRLGSPPDSAWVSASVRSWKTEDIGFDVSGRVRWVKEPGEDIQGRVYADSKRENEIPRDLDGTATPIEKAPRGFGLDTVAIAELANLDEGDELRVEIEEMLDSIEEASREFVYEGTKIAEIDDERYRLRLLSAVAEVQRQIQNYRAARIELNQQLKFEMDSAKAEEELALTEYKRLVGLQNAVSDAERDSANTKRLSAQANVNQLKAKQAAKEAEIMALIQNVKLALQDQRDAERDLEDCALYSSFNGQIAEVFVVPGSVVSIGQPVATVQMMNPIKIELEVSGDDARRLRNRQRLPLRVTTADGRIQPNEGFLYLIDPVADPQTRTYTLTLLMINENTGSSKAQSKMPVTDQAWRVDFPFLPGAADQGFNYVPQQAIHEDSQGYFLWRITNFKRNEPLPPDNLIEVSKLRITLGDIKFPFLGNWVFQQIIVVDDSFKRGEDLVAGELMVSEGRPDDWNGDTILVDRGSQWMVRPGDLVQVDLSDSAQREGYFVAMDAIVHEGGKSYLFVVEDGVVNRYRLDDEAGADQTGKTTTSPFLRIEKLVDVKEDGSMPEPPPVDVKTLDGKKYVTRGVHYLREGEQVRTTDRSGGSQ